MHSAQQQPMNVIPKRGCRELEMVMCHTTVKNMYVQIYFLALGHENSITHVHNVKLTVYKDTEFWKNIDKNYVDIDTYSH